MNLQALYTHLDAHAKRALNTAADLAVRERYKVLTIELVLLTLVRDRAIGPSVLAALSRCGADAPAIESYLAERVAGQPRRSGGSQGLPDFDETLARLLRESWSLSFDDYGDTAVSALRLFETLARKGEHWPSLAAGLPGFAVLDVAKLAAEAGSAGRSSPAAPGQVIGSDERYPELSRHGCDLVAAARAGDIDVAVDIDETIRAVSSVLLRRRQNSAVVVGEAGVGKTAAALGFVRALAIGEGPVPDRLAETPVWSLDLSSLRAGAAVPGALEERLQVIRREVADDAMVLFLDDLDLLFGPQGQGGDALRSLLDDGAVRVLGTCRWREWRRLVEPDAGLARRLAPVRIQEPDDARSVAIVSGLAPALCEHHGVEVSEEAVASSVALSRRYIVGRQLPDKAVAALDSACARATMRAGARSGGPVAVLEEDVAEVVSELAGVPVGALLTDASQTATRLEGLMGERVIGQASALARCASQARSYLAGLSDRRRPVGALMFCGPSGVGKTETAHVLADMLFGGRLLTVNMSEYQEAHTVSGLKGAPAGYVGYGEGGVLTEGIRRTPYCVLLLDEIEKAHSDVIEMLYQVLDRGWMSDAEGLEADFSNCLIILTTNAGDSLIEQASRAPTPPPEAELLEVLVRELGKQFPAAFLGRLQVVPYWPLSEASLMQIAAMRLRRLAENYEASHRSVLSFDEGVLSWLAERVKSTPQGARFLDGIIAGRIRPVVAEYVLARLAEGEPAGSIEVSLAGDAFVVRPVLREADMLDSMEPVEPPGPAPVQTTEGAM